MDIVTIDKTEDKFRILFDTKGRFVLHRVPAEEAQFILCRVRNVIVGSKASVGRNPFKTGREAAIPFLVTHDGRTIRYPNPVIKTNDTVKIDLKTGKITGHVKFETGNISIITKGSNIGRVGVIVHTDHHPGSFDIVHLRDSRGASFATRLPNVFVIGEGTAPWISLPRGKGIKLSIIEERDKQGPKKHEKPVKGEKKRENPNEETEKPKEPKKETKKDAPKDGGKKEAPKEGGKKETPKESGKTETPKDGGKKEGKKEGKKDGGKKESAKKGK